MPGDVGLVAHAVETIASWFLSEDGYGEFKKRRKLKSKKEEAQRALDQNDWPALKRIVDEFKRLSDAP